MLEYLIVTLIRFVLILLLFNFVMHCIISTVVVAFEINYLSIYVVCTCTMIMHPEIMLAGR